MFEIPEDWSICDDVDPVQEDLSSVAFRSTVDEDKDWMDRIGWRSIGGCLLRKRVFEMGTPLGIHDAERVIRKITQDPPEDLLGRDDRPKIIFLAGTMLLSWAGNEFIPCLVFKDNEWKPAFRSLSVRIKQQAFMVAFGSLNKEEE